MMNFDQLPEWIRKEIESLGVENKNFDGEMIEMELYFASLAAEHRAKATKERAIATAISEHYRYMMQLAGMQMMNAAKELLPKTK